MVDRGMLGNCDCMLKTLYYSYSYLGMTVQEERKAETKLKSTCVQTYSFVPVRGVNRKRAESKERKPEERNALSTYLSRVILILIQADHPGGVARWTKWTMVLGGEGSVTVPNYRPRGLVALLKP